jgi:hypothetical protein
MSNYDMIKKEAHNVYALCGTLYKQHRMARKKKHYSNDAESKITRDIKTHSVWIPRFNTPKPKY